MSPLDLMPPKAPPHCRKTTRSILCPVWVRRQRQRICFLNHEPAGLFLSNLAPSPCQSNDWMSLLLPSRASRMISQPCRSSTFLMFWFSPAGRLILAVFDLSHVYRTIGCHCSRLHETAGRVHSLVAHRPFLMFGLSPAGRTILESCRSVSAFSLHQPRRPRLEYQGEAHRKLPPWTRWE